jgi:TrmH family RNA methyltransferase
MRLPPALTSGSHPLARQARALGRGARQRREEGLFLVEGPRGVTEALDAGADIAWVLVAASRAERGSVAELAERCLRAGWPVQPVRETVLERIAPSEHGPGLLAACRLPRRADATDELVRSASDGVLVVCWDVQDPGNLGTLVRSARAFGAAGLLALGGADPWNPKAVRASAGAIHRLPVARSAGLPDAASFVEALRDAERKPMAAVARDGTSLDRVDWSGRVALLLGSEVRGLPGEIEDESERVSIPLADDVESLSVPVAGSILLAASAAVRR